MAKEQKTMRNTNLEQQFMTLVEENKKIIYKVSIMYADVEMPIEDTYQDIILNLWTAFPSFKGESKSSTWVYRIALNTCVSALRKKQSRPQTSPLTCDLDDLLDDSQEYRAQVKELYRLISKLSKLEKAIIMLWLDERNYDEIAGILGISKNNVGVKINRIKEKLQKMSNN